MLFDIHPSDDLFARLHMLQAGDEVVVHAGTYTTPGLVNVTWPGTAQKPIIVRAADGERVIIQGTPSQNVLDLAGSYFTLTGFEMKGGSHGVRLGATDHATIEGLVLHDLGDVGISCNRPGQECSELTIRYNEIYATGLAGTGEGMYLGGNDATNIFRDSLIERNYIHDLGGDQGDGIEVKTGASGVIVRDNVIVRAKYPAITMYGYAGTGKQNVVERNFVWHTVDNGIQIVGQVVVRNNIILDAGANGIQSKASQGQTPHDLVIAHNTVVGTTGPCLKTNDWASGTNQIVANNALYCTGGTAIDFNGGGPVAIWAGNVGLGTSNAPRGFELAQAVEDDIGPAPQAYVTMTSMLLNRGDPAYAVADDFNGTLRLDHMPDIGAYERTMPSNPGWPLGEGFKAETPVVPDGYMTPGYECLDFCKDVESGSGCCDARTPGSSGLLAGLVLLAMGRRRR